MRYYRHGRQLLGLVRERGGETRTPMVGVQWAMIAIAIAER
jgi:hypothetical protein